MIDLPITDENGVEVPQSWAEAKDTGALTFWAEEACPACGKCRRFYVADLRCYGCANPPPPKYGDVAPDLSVAIARGFRLYTPAEPCPTHPHSPYTTEGEQCDGCRHDAAFAAAEVGRKEREAAQQAEYRDLRREAAQRAAITRSIVAKRKATERAARLITGTAGRRKSSKSRFPKRALAKLTSLPE